MGRTTPFDFSGSTPRKQGQKRVSCCDMKPNFMKLRLVYKVHASEEKNTIFLSNYTRPVGQVLLEIQLSEIQECSSPMGGRAEVIALFLLPSGFPGQKLRLLEEKSRCCIIKILHMLSSIIYLKI